MNVVIKVQNLADKAKPGNFVKDLVNARDYALNSTAKYLREEIKTQGRLGATGGYLNWPKLNPFTGRISGIRGRGGKAKLLKATRGRGKSKYRYAQRMSGGGYAPVATGTSTLPMQRLMGAVRSRIYRDSGKVQVGFLRTNIWPLVIKMHKGFEATVTKRSSRMLFGIGVPFRPGMNLKVPPRPWIEKVYQKEASYIPRHFEQKFSLKWRGQ